MKISFEFDDDNAVYEVIDSVFVSLLKRELNSNQWFLDNDGWKHPDDVKRWKKNIKCIKYLLEDYGRGSEE